MMYEYNVELRVRVKFIAPLNLDSDEIEAYAYEEMVDKNAEIEGILYVDKCLATEDKDV